MVNKEYKRAYESLNDQQKKAVELTEGPVLVVAGPGTGKTQLLSTRVAHILKTTDTRAANILCLSFTNKAAVNMKERIIRLAGQDGTKVSARTFHSFAGEIMNSYPDYFWNAADLSVAPESVQLDIIESIVAQLPLDNPLALKFAGQYTLLSDIQRAINLAKDAGLTPDKLKDIIEANLAYIDVIEEPLAQILSSRLSAKTLDKLQSQVDNLPKQEIDLAVFPLVSLSTILSESLATAIEHDSDSGKTTHTSKWKSRFVQTEAGQKGMFDERRRNNWWLELADIYQKYRESIHLRGFYDYADMLVEVIAQLEQNPEILADAQERYSYVMIDEFQDTNPAQMRLAHLVADHHTSGGSPNLMVVGDDDQSIFKFNGAELNNMLGFRRRYKNAQVIVLTDNYRSTQAVLDTAKAIIEQAEVRLVNVDKKLNKKLVAVNPPAESGVIQARSYSSRELQMSLIAREIHKNYQSDQTVAVLARGHDSLIRMTGLLQSLKVPVRYEQQSNIFDHEIVDQVCLVARLLAEIQAGNIPQTDALIHKIVRHPLWGIEPQALWNLAVSVRRGNGWLNTLLASKHKDLRQTGEWYVAMAREADNQPLAVTVEQILGLRKCGEYTSPLRDYFMGGQSRGSNQYFHSLSAMQLLRALVHEFARSGEPTLADLVRFIEINQENNRVVADESPFVTGGHAVQLLSVHKAKGLEFDTVYIIDAVEDNWQPRSGRRKPPANLPLQPNGDDADDYVRLAYVAATRAKSSLLVSAYHLDHAGKEVALSPIFQGALPVEKLSETNQSKLITVLEQNLNWPDLSGGEEKAMLRARLEGYSLSVTHLLNFLDLSRGGPQYFKERNLLRLPQAKTTALAFGTAMHKALQVAQLLTNKNKFNLSQVQKAFSKALQAEQLPSAQTTRFDKKGRQTLDNLFGKVGYQMTPGGLPEQNIHDIKLANALLRGKLDRVDINGERLSIIDYKTGRPLSSFSTTGKNLAIKAYKHKLQLIFYALMASRHASFSKHKDIEGQMVYVEADSTRDLVRSYSPTGEDIARLEQLIEAIWPKIINLDLPDVSAYSQDFEGMQAFEQDLIERKI